MMTRFLFLVGFIVTALAVSVLEGANLEIADGATLSITDPRDLADSDRYGNKGTLKITAAVILNIAAGVLNIEPLEEGREGLDLGVVNSLGTINAEKTIRFQEGSNLSGEVYSSQNVIFDGASTLAGTLQAKVLVFNASENQDENGNMLASQIDLSNGATLDIEELSVRGSVEITMKDGVGLELNSLVVEGTGTSLNVSENLTVLGNYTGGAGSTMVSQPDDDGWNGTITLLGGGELVEGTNNLIMQSVLFAKELRVKNRTAIAEELTLYGDFTVLSPESGKESLVTVDYGLMTSGKTTVQSGGILRLNGESSSNMIYFGYYYYNGLFFGGLELQNGATLDVASADQTISVALGDTSTFLSGSKVTAKNVHLSGVDTAGSTKLQLVQNSGTITASGLFQLTSVNFENKNGGLLTVNGIKLASASVLNLSGGDSESNNGGLTFIGDSPYLEISANSSLIAEGKTLNFTGVEVINHNPTNGIQAKSLLFGNGGSLSGAGVYAADATFESGSKVKLDNNGDLDFGNHAVWLQEGSTIALTIGTNGVGAIVTEGKVTMEDGVVLEIVDGSNYNGRVKIFKIIQGSADSVFTEVTLADSLFFKLNQTDSDGNGGLLVEIVKTADLTDYAHSSNQKNLGDLIDRLLFNNDSITENQKLVFDALMQIESVADYQQSLDDLSGATRENSILFALSSPWRIPMENIGFNRLSLALENNQAATNQPATRGQKIFRKPNWSLPKWSFSHDLWADIYYNYTKYNADGNAPGGDGNLGGFYMGTAFPTPFKESLLGISFGYSAGQYKQGLDKVDLGNFQIGLYGGINLFERNLQLRGFVGYGIQDYKMSRNIRIAPYLPTPVSGKTDGNSISAALYLVRPVDISERFLAKPMLGIDLERLTQDGFTENGDFNAVLLSYDDVTLLRTMFRLGITGDYVFRRVGLTGRFMYGLKIAGDKTAAAQHHFLNPADASFRVESVNLGSSQFDLGFGSRIGLNRLQTALLFLDYNAALSKNSNSHTASLGLLWKR
ncbi:MAG: autotransporter domain-containing protein [Planctomycetaceae bacterium]|nr:autotransporter domain-containing protein [Planctomycetaceae bacterium]